MLPKNLKYGSKVESANCKSFRTNIQPQNGTGDYKLGDTISVNIPTRRNLVMVPSESYLKFNITVTNASGATNYYRWDSCGAHGVISQVRVSHGSNQLENINIYGQLAKLLFDLQVNTPSSSGKFNILAGTRGDSMITGQTIVGDADDVNGIAITPGAATGAQLASVLNSVLTTSVVATNSGDYFGAVANNATSTSQTYCLNLISLCGSLCQNQYLPLFAMDSAPLRLDITLVDSITKAFSCVSSDGALSNIAVSNVEYVANMIELSDEAMMTIVNSLQGEPLQFVLPSWSNYQSTATLPAGASTQVNVAIPAKYSSIKSLFSCFRDKYNTVLFMPYSSVTAGLSSYQYRIGSNLAPLKAPASTAEYFAEVLKAIGSMSDNYHSPAIDKISYSLSATVTEASIANNLLYPHTIQRGNTTSGSFCVGLDLESFANADKSSIFTGYNTNTDDIFLTLNYPAPGAAVTLRIDSFALFDQVLVCANGTSFVRF